MKKVFKAFVLFVAIASMASLVSCTKDNAKLIVGKWQFERVNVVITADDPEIQELIDDYFGNVNEELNEDLRGSSFEFNDDNTLVISMVDPESHENLSASHPYTIDGDKLTFDGDTYTIKTLNNSSLVFELFESINEDGVTAEIVETFEFKR